MPTIPLVQALIQKTPPGFLFTIKAHRSMTHEVWNAMKSTAPGEPPFPDLKQGLKTTSQLAPAFMAFREAVAPMADAGKLGTVVLQYPPCFRDTPENRRFLLTTRDLLAGLPLSIEFRDLTWHNDDAFAFLRQEHLGYVAVDEPQLHNLLPLVPAVTSDVAYLRLHGRNPHWFGASREERYDYLYSKNELEQMLPSIHAMAASTPLMFIMTNNCHRGQAVQNAQDLRAMILFPERSKA